MVRFLLALVLKRNVFKGLFKSNNTIINSKIKFSVPIKGCLFFNKTLKT